MPEDIELELKNIMAEIKNECIGSEDIIFPSSQLPRKTTFELLLENAPAEIQALKSYIYSTILTTARYYVDQVAEENSVDIKTYQIYGTYFVCGFGECTEQSVLALLKLNEKDIFPFENCHIKDLNNKLVHNFLLVKRENTPYTVDLNKCNEDAYVFDPSLCVIEKADAYLKNKKVTTYLDSINCNNYTIEAPKLFKEKLDVNLLQGMQDFCEKLKPLRQALQDTNLYGNSGLTHITHANFKEKLVTIVNLYEKFIQKQCLMKNYSHALVNELNKITDKSEWKCSKKMEFIPPGFSLMIHNLSLP